MNDDGPYHAMINRLLAQDTLMKLGTFQAIGELQPSISKTGETYSLFTSGFNGAAVPSAVISGSAITVDLSSLFFGLGQHNSYLTWNIGEMVTGLFNPATSEFSLSWDRVFDGGTPQAPASFFLSGVVHFDTQPVPIPAAAWLFGSGLTGVAVLIRRRLCA